MPRIADRDARDTINVSSDEPFIRSLHRAGLVSLEPRLTRPFVAGDAWTVLPVRAKALTSLRAGVAA